MNTLQPEILFLTKDEILFDFCRSKFKKGNSNLYLVSAASEMRNFIREKDINAIILDSDYSYDIIGLRAEEAIAKLKNSLNPMPIVIILKKENYSGQILKLLEIGAHEVLTHPIKPQILVEQMKALVRIFFKKPIKKRKYFTTKNENMLMNYPARKCFIKLGPKGERQEIKLTKTEFQILYRLLQKKGELVSFEDFRKNLWPTASSSKTIIHLLHQIISNIRKKTHPCPVKIESIRGEGFRIS